MHVRSLVVCSIFALSACGGGGGGKASSDELGRAVIDTFVKKDQTALVAMMASVDAAVDACPAVAAEKDEITKKRAKAETKLIESFGKCTALDWSKATIKEVKGGDAKKPIEGCPDLIQARDIDVTAEIDGKTVTVNIDDPIVIKGKYYLFDRLKCSGGGAEHPAVAAVRAAADKACACKDAACASAVMDSFSKDMQQFASDQPGEADVKTVGDEVKRMTECVQKLSQ